MFRHTFHQLFNMDMLKLAPLNLDPTPSHPSQSVVYSSLEAFFNQNPKILDCRANS